MKLSILVDALKTYDKETGFFRKLFAFMAGSSDSSYIARKIRTICENPITTKNDQETDRDLNVRELVEVVEAIHWHHDAKTKSRQPKAECKLFQTIEREWEIEYQVTIENIHTPLFILLSSGFFNRQNFNAVIRHPDPNNQALAFYYMRNNKLLFENNTIDVVSGHPKPIEAQRALKSLLRHQLLSLEYLSAIKNAENPEDIVQVILRKFYANKNSGYTGSTAAAVFEPKQNDSIIEPVSPPRSPVQSQGLFATMAQPVQSYENESKSPMIITNPFRPNAPL